MKHRTVPQLSICVRYINTVGEICEDFIGFVKLEKMAAQSIAYTLLSTAREWGLVMSDLVAQGYDGVSVMSSDKNGVQAKIKQKYPNATYVQSFSCTKSCCINWM